jgi:uncharacterized protein YndB with AHSA1/START domain
VSDTELVFDTTLETSRDRVFAAVSEAHQLQQWLCDACESEPRLHGRLLMRWIRAESSPEPFEARWVEFAPPGRASFRGGHAGYPEGDAGTVRYELVATGAGTRLHVCHAVPARPGYEALLEPWRAAWPRALGRLRRHFAPPAEARP